MSALTDTLTDSPGTLLGRALAMHVLAFGGEVWVEPALPAPPRPREPAAEPTGADELALHPSAIGFVTADELMQEWDLGERDLARMREHPTFPEPVEATGDGPVWELATVWRWYASSDL